MKQSEVRRLALLNGCGHNPFRHGISNTKRIGKTNDSPQSRPTVSSGHRGIRRYRPRDLSRLCRSRLVCRCALSSAES